MASTEPTPVFDIAVPKGTRVTKLVQVQTNGVVVALPVGTTAKMQIRSAPGNALLAELNTGDGSLTVDVNTAIVTITMSTALTAAFGFDRAMYDLKLIYPPDSEWDRIVEGKIIVFPGITL